MDFSITLLEWFRENGRDLPWRQTHDPYAIWLSEIILQQTQVKQGWEYWERFMRRWPTVEALAEATEDEVLREWQGLGYYSRARNLHHCAQQVTSEHKGQFPPDYEKLKQLKGIGDYTAAAIASIAFNLPHAVVDGNVYRVLARLYDIDTPININEGQKLFAQLAEDLLNRKQPGLHNQALMEFGALHCTPKNPNCLLCPLQAQCLAFAHQTVMQRPVKLQKVKVTTRYFNYLVIKTNGCIYLHKRSDNDIWKNLYDFPCIESQKPMTVEEVIASEAFLQLIENNPFTIIKSSPIFTHKLTHRTILAHFIEIKLEKELLQIQTNDLFLARESELGSFPIPRLIDLYLNN